MNRNRLEAVSTITKLVFGEKVGSSVSLKNDEAADTLRRRLSSESAAIVSNIVRRSYEVLAQRLVVRYSLSTNGENLAC